ncbi:MAG TPA: hypothetical protein PLD25_09845 [Chloroflexota bacterium]|nr:hypothetical protein [Chloroflexota bacterium]HUM71970.1 hypothetical protein [Chloroflexota bacterium]
MAELLGAREIAGVRLFDLTLSEDEIEAMATAFSIILASHNDQMLDDAFGADREEIEAILHDLERVIAAHQPEAAFD